jgi:lipopolysaccharide heptosyltransferase II
METGPWDECRNLLAVRLDTIGDVLMTTPAMRALRGARRRITLLTSSGGAEAGRLVPEVDEVLTYDPPWMKGSPHRTGEADRALVEVLRGRRFDGAVIFTAYTQSAWPAALLCHLAGIPRRLAHLREKPYQVLTDWVPDPEPERGIRHEVRRQLDLVASVGCRTDDERLSVEVPPAAEARGEDILNSLAPGPAWAVVHPGATAPSRRYPAELFVEVCRSLARDHGWTLVLTGSGEEAGLVEEIRAGVPGRTHSLAGVVSLADLAAVLRRAPVLISNNTGPVHVAAAVGTPVVDIYALTNPQHTPWGVPNAVLFHDVPCRNCQSSVCLEGHHNCLRMVPPAAVVEAAVRLVGAGVRAPGWGGFALQSDG